MAQKYSRNDIILVRQLIGCRKFAKAEEILEWFYNHDPEFLDAKIEYAKSLLFTKTLKESDKKVVDERRLKAERIIEEIMNDQQADMRIINIAKVIKAKNLLCKSHFGEAYEIYDELLDTERRNDAIFGIATIESRLGDIYKAYETFSFYTGKFDERVIKEQTIISIAIQDFETADRNIKVLKNTFQRDKILIEEVYLEMRRMNYKKAYELFSQLTANMPQLSKSYESIRLFLRYKLGMTNLKNVSDNYFLSQVREYNTNRVIKYISSKNFEGKNYRFKDDSESGIRMLYRHAKEWIADDVPIKCELEDYYTIATTECIGFVRDNIPTNVLKIGTISGTKNIVSIRPIESIQYIREDIERKHGPQRTFES